MAVTREAKHSVLKEDKELFRKLEEVTSAYWRISFPATKIHNLVAKSSAKLSKAKAWKRKIMSSISMCKLHEAILKLKLSPLYGKVRGVLKEIYGKSG